MKGIPARIYSRLMAQEYLIEVMFANNLAAVSPEISEAFKRDLVSRPGRLPPQPGPVDVKVLEAQDAAVKADIVDILRKVSAREANLRDLRARPN